MADGDTLAMAEDKVLQRAQRKAVEEAGIYLESTFHDYESVRNGKRTQISSLEIRTLAAAITKTDVLESRRTGFHHSHSSRCEFRSAPRGCSPMAVRRTICRTFPTITKGKRRAQGATPRDTGAALRRAHSCDRPTRPHGATGASAPPLGHCPPLAQPSSKNRPDLTSRNAGSSVRRSIDCQGADLSKDGFAGLFQQISPK